MGLLTDKLLNKKLLLIDLDRLKLNQISSYLSQNNIDQVTFATSISAAKEHLQNNKFDYVFAGVNRERTGLNDFLKTLVVDVPPLLDLIDLITEMKENQDTSAIDDILGLTSEAFIQDDIDSLFMNANFINASFQQINLDLKVLQFNEDHMLLSTTKYQEDPKELTLCLAYNVEGQAGEMVITGVVTEVECIEETQTLKFLPTPNHMEDYEILRKLNNHLT